MLQARGGGGGFLFLARILGVRGNTPSNKKRNGYRRGQIMEEGRGEEISWERRRAHSCVVLG
jgi:hypothetical protein